MATVAVLGLGPMGRGVAANLLRARSAVTVWNRSKAPADALVAAGALRAETPEDAAADTVLSVLPDVDQLRAITGPAVWRQWRARGVRRVVVMSTTSPSKVEDLDGALAEFGITVADAPMSGGETGAAEGRLSVMVGCHEEDWAELRVLLEPVASRIERFGNPGAGSIAKLCNQIVVAGTLTSIAEAFAIAERARIDVVALSRVLESGLAASAVLAVKKERLLSGDYSPSGSAVNQVKDLRYLTEVAARVHADIPVTNAILPLFAAVVAAGLGDLDHSVVLEQLRDGLPKGPRPR